VDNTGAGSASKPVRSTVGSNLPVPPVNIGPRSTPGYESLAASAVSSIGSNRKAFAGQRDDVFFVDLGSVFDLLGLRPFNGAHTIPLAGGAGVDAVNGYNVHTIALQLPITDLTRMGMMPANAMGLKAVIGVAAPAARARACSRPAATTLPAAPSSRSRLGNLLINEALIGMGQKDRNRPSRGRTRSSPRYTNPVAALVTNLSVPAGCPHHRAQ
jgi:hypothetical protein